MNGLFTHPDAWPLLALAPVAWLVLIAFDRRRRELLRGLTGPRTDALADHSSGRRRGRRVLLGAGLVLALAAFLQPAWGDALRKVDQRGVDVLVCLDVSRSMLARDQDPSRLGAAKRAIQALSERAVGDRLGLVVFAGDARLSVPLTRDLGTLATLAGAADPVDVSRGGTDLGNALEAALGALGDGAGEHETVLLLTDGEDIGGRGLATAAACRERGIAVHCVGFGSRRGSKIATTDEDGNATFLVDRAGKEVVSAMDPVSLGRIAEATGGVFVEAAEEESPLVTLYESHVLPMARKAFEAEERRERPNRYQWPLALALALWILELCISERR